MGGRIIPYDDYDYYDYYSPGYATNPDFLPQTEIEVIVGHNASVAVIDFDGLRAFGDAKRNKGERKNDEVGRDLALGRAYIDMGKQLIARAHKTLDCQGQGEAPGPTDSRVSGGHKEA